MATPASSRLGSVPIPRTGLIGREAERGTAHALLIDQGVPLLTLTGPGGVGKTRLALAITHDAVGHFDDGAVFVDLARIGDPSLVAPAVARTLGMAEGGDQSLVERLVIALRRSHLLLVFDNCEHLLTATAEAASNLLAECPRLQILATSRAPLRIRGEQELPIEPLPLPSVTSRHTLDLADNPAVQLFIERARAARPDFQLADSNAAVVASRATSCWRTLGIVEAPGLNGRDGYSRCERR